MHTKVYLKLCCEKSVNEFLWVHRRKALYSPNELLKHQASEMSWCSKREPVIKRPQYVSDNLKGLRERGHTKRLQCKEKKY
ncbi:unnamed protein product [Ceratitis capitata]|uniref:(Mediterranean fruit fly) hypothetical protein n=1 Tax=Ceratitis capitata TaxID=7213 RepID=A0A811V8X2_CERCA|nr:unnamed protein product [Ceratitis capitata]